MAGTHTAAAFLPTYQVQGQAPGPASARYLEGRIQAIGGVGGAASIVGSVKVKGAPDYPVRRKVYLLREPGLAVVASTLSDPVTGEYRFDGLSPAARYTVVSFDHEHAFRAVIADNLTPEVV